MKARYSVTSLLLTSLVALLLLMPLPSQATAIVYSFRAVDNTGAAQAGVSITSIKICPTSGASPTTLSSSLSTSASYPVSITTITTGSSSVTVEDAGDGDYFFAYDPEVSGEALIKFVVTKSGSTFASPIAVLCSKDSSRVLNADVATSTRGTSTLTQSQVTGGAYALQTDGSGYIKGSTGTGTGQFSLSSGKMAATVNASDVSGNIPALVAAYASGQDPATVTLNATASSFNTTGSIGYKINAAGSASDPLTSALAGYTGAHTAGNLLRLIDSSVDSSGRVTVGAYGPGADPASLLLTSPSNKIKTVSGGYVQIDLTQPLVPQLDPNDDVNGGLLGGRATLGKVVVVGTPGSAGSKLRIYAKDKTTMLVELDLSTAGSRL